MKKFVKKHSWWFVAAGVVLYFGTGSSTSAPTFTPGGSGQAGGGATGSWPADVRY